MALVVFPLNYALIILSGKIEIQISIFPPLTLARDVYRYRNFGF